MQRKYALLAHPWAQICLLALSLAGCASAPTTPTTPIAPSSTTIAAQRYHAAIELDGRLSVRYQRNGQDEAMHGSFAWSQNAVRTQLTLLSPLGQTLAIIALTPQGATLTQPGQPLRNAADADALAADTLGWPLPIANLHNWLQGYALDAHGQRITVAGSTERMRTPDGWQLQFPTWQNDDSGASHPKRIDLGRQTNQAGAIEIRIAIDHWQPQP